MQSDPLDGPVEEPVEEPANRSGDFGRFALFCVATFGFIVFLVFGILTAIDIRTSQDFTAAIVCILLAAWLSVPTIVFFRSLRNGWTREREDAETQRLAELPFKVIGAVLKAIGAIILIVLVIAFGGVFLYMFFESMPAWAASIIIMLWVISWQLDNLRR